MAEAIAAICGISTASRTERVVHDSHFTFAFCALLAVPRRVRGV
jgi:hypothetical protein